MSPAGQNLFETLRASLAGFRDKVEGAEGRRVALLGNRSGTIPELARLVLGSIADVLTWLGDSLHSAPTTLRVADAAIALIELASDLLEVLGSELPSGELPADLGLDLVPFQAVVDAVAAGNAVRTRETHLAGLLPVPEDLTAVREELEKLLGERVNPALPGPGALGILLADMERGHGGA